MGAGRGRLSSRVCAEVDRLGGTSDQLDVAPKVGRPACGFSHCPSHCLGPNTKLGISVIAVWHITDHYGQLVAYLRLNGIVPPFTQKYGLKVR
jgi:hypothetical protein